MEAQKSPWPCREHGYVESPAGDRLGERCVYCGEHSRVSRIRTWWKGLFR